MKTFLAALLVFASFAAHADLEHPYPLTSVRYKPSGFAADQRRAGAASGTNSFLVAWVDDFGTHRSLRAGIGGPDGSWIETPELSNAVAEGLEEPVAVFNGEGYLVIAKIGSRFVAYRISRFAQVLGSTELPAELTRVGGVAWNGSMYAVTGTAGPDPNFQHLVLIGLTAEGAVIGAPVTFATPQTGHFLLRTGPIASDGESFVLAYDAAVGCIQCRQVRVLRFSSSFQQLGGGINIENHGGTTPALAWSGTEYLVITWGTVQAVTRIAPNGARLGSTPINLSFDSRVVWTGTRYAAVSGRTLVYIDNAGNVSPRIDFMPPISRRFVSFPVTAGFGELAIVTSQDLFGAERLHVRWVDSFLAPPPAPRLVAVTEGTLRWERAELASGYRIEMSVDEGPWRELERLAGGNDTSAAFTPRPGHLYRFRLRAWNTSGISGYSNEKGVYIWPRPRGVR